MGRSEKSEKVMINGDIIIEAGKVPTIEEFEQRIDKAVTSAKNSVSNEED